MSEEKSREKRNGKINYKNLRKINPGAARLAVTEYLSTNKSNISDHLEPLGSKRIVIYNILKKEREGFGDYLLREAIIKNTLIISNDYIFWLERIAYFPFLS